MKTTENEVISRIRDFAQKSGITIVLVSHHYVNFRKAGADQIFYIKDGELRESGTHQELVAKPEGEYAKMYNEEKNPYADEAKDDTSSRAIVLREREKLP